MESFIFYALYFLFKGNNEYFEHKEKLYLVFKYNFFYMKQWIMEFVLFMAQELICNVQKLALK